MSTILIRVVLAVPGQTQIDYTNPDEICVKRKLLLFSHLALFFFFSPLIRMGYWIRMSKIWPTRAHKTMHSINQHLFVAKKEKLKINKILVGSRSS